jgi:hypothetical protein
MSPILEALRALQGREPPASVELFRKLNSIDFSSIDEDDFQRLVDLVLRARADCIVANQREADVRSEFKKVMLELIARMYSAFAVRPHEVENNQFFKKFVDSALEIDA